MERKGREGSNTFNNVALFMFCVSTMLCHAKNIHTWWTLEDCSKIEGDTIRHQIINSLQRDMFLHSVVQHGRSPLYDGDNEVF